MKKLYLILMVLFIAACNDDSPAVASAPEQNDYGLEDAVRNFPVGWIYVEYPTFSDGTNSIDPPSPCNMGYMNDFTSTWVNQSLSGTWASIDDYDGRFFRTESTSGRSIAFQGDTELEGGDIEPSLPQFLQLDALQAHRHGVGQAGFSFGSNDVAGGGIGISYHNGGGNIDEASYNTIGKRTLEHNVAKSKDLTDNFTNATTGETNSAPRVDVETRPENYTMRMWRKIADNSSATDCVIARNVVAAEYKNIVKTTKDKEGNVLSIDTIKKVVSRKAVYDGDKAEYRILTENKDAKIIPTRGIVITNAPDIEIFVGREDVEVIK